MRWFLESDKIWDLCYFISNGVNALKNMISSLIKNWKSVFFILFSFLLHIYIYIYISFSLAEKKVIIMIHKLAKFMTKNNWSRDDHWMSSLGWNKRKGSITVKLSRVKHNSTVQTSKTCLSTLSLTHHLFLVENQKKTRN